MSVFVTLKQHGQPGLSACLVLMVDRERTKVISGMFMG